MSIWEGAKVGFSGVVEVRGWRCQACHGCGQMHGLGAGHGGRI